MTLIVVSDLGDWPLDVPGARVVAAQAYLTDPAFSEEDREVRVFNLCRSYRYQSLGYYVSLLAEARGHTSLPGVGTIEDMQSQNLVRLLAEGLDALIQRSLAPLTSDAFELDIYFGRNVARHCDALGKRLFSLLQAPLLRVHFERRHGEWRIHRLHPIAAGDIVPAEQTFARHAAAEYFSAHGGRAATTPAPRFDLAILHDPTNPHAASNAVALRKFADAAQAQALHAEFITPADLGRLPEFDALFIRDTTFVDHYTYRFSRRAAAEGLVVIDDPESILKCNNKVYLAELLARHQLPAPRTLLVHKGNVDRIIPTLDLPCVLKQPDSSFSVGIERVERAEDLAATVGALLERSELVVAQEWLPTEFDWRVGILDRRVLFVCKYYMVAGHWQIVRHENDGRWSEGPTEAVAVHSAPEEVLRTALAAANLIGDGFYGVDLKQVGTRYYIIEINDNPNVDAGNEDQVLEDALYREVMSVFVRRIEERVQKGRTT
jgi:glutathione synthase/RimK-type ligase-like ATP-grasp enzyme